MLFYFSKRYIFRGLLSENGYLNQFSSEVSLDAYMHALKILKNRNITKF